MQNMYCKYIKKKKSASVIVAETQRRVKKITEPFFPLQADIVQDAVEGRFSSAPMIEMTLPSSLDPTLAPPGIDITV